MRTDSRSRRSVPARRLRQGWESWTADRSRGTTRRSFRRGPPRESCVLPQACVDARGTWVLQYDFTRSDFIRSDYSQTAVRLESDLAYDKAGFRPLSVDFTA